MKKLNHSDFSGAKYPEKIIQVGEGDSLPAFVDWQIDKFNECIDLNVHQVLENVNDWNQNLNLVNGLAELICTLLESIRQQGMRAALRNC